MTPRVIARQLSHPAGLLGRVVAWLMNRRNERLNSFAIAQLDLKLNDRVLEIGFGGGLALARLISRSGFVTGVDRSHDMVGRAMDLFAGDVKAGRAAFQVGSVEALPFASNSFTKVLAVNTIYFWNPLNTGLREIRRVLSAGGRLALGFLPQEAMDRLGLPAEIFHHRTLDDVTGAMRDAGFEDVQAMRPDADTPWFVVTGSRPLVETLHDHVSSDSAQGQRRARPASGS